MAGAGIQPAGTTPAGTGSLTLAVAPGGSVLRDPNTSLQQGGRFIDPITRQYTFDSYGRSRGMSEAAQLVFLACTTSKGSAAHVTLGNELFKIDRITDNYAKRVQDIYTAALSDLVARRLISVIDITVNQVTNSPTRLLVYVRFQDLTTGIEEQVQV